MSLQPPSEIPNKTLDLLWDSLNNGDLIELQELLRVLLVSEPPDSAIRQWTLSELKKMIWVVDLSGLESVFRDCNENSGIACSQILVENGLVFRERTWKTELLQTVFDKCGVQEKYHRCDFTFQNLRFSMSYEEAAQYARDLGLREFIGYLSSTASSCGSERSMSEWSQATSLDDELLGTDHGNSHPVEVLSGRLSHIDASELVSRIVDGEEALIDLLTRYQERLRVRCDWWMADQNPNNRTRVLTTQECDDLLTILGAMYNEFLRNPPPSVLTDLTTFKSFDAFFRYVVAGGCEGSLKVDEYAFDSPSEAARLRARTRDLANPAGDR